MFFTVTVKWFVVKHKRNKLTFLATLLAWAMSSLILRMLVVTLFTGFFSSTTFSLSSSSGTSTFRFSTAGQIREHEQKLAYDFLFFFYCFHNFHTETVLNTNFSPASLADATAFSYAAAEYSLFLMLWAHCCTLLLMGVTVSSTSAERFRVSSATSKEKFRRCGVRSENGCRLTRNRNTENWTQSVNISVWWRRTIGG